MSGDVAALDPQRFREVLGHYPTGVAVITALDPGGAPVGFTVGSFTSISLDPPLVGFFAITGSSTLATILRHGMFCVNVLADAQEAICRTFARRAADRFSSLDWFPSPLGSPVLADSKAFLDCRVELVHRLGDHDLVVGRVQSLEVLSVGLPLLFFKGGYGSFSAPSLLARPDSDLVHQLALADIGRREMEGLSRDLTAACVMSAIVDEHVVQLLSTTAPNSGSAPPAVGTRMPWVPPIGRPFAAWAGDAVRQGYLDRAQPALSPADRRRYDVAFDCIVERGWSVLLHDDGLAAAESFLHQQPSSLNPERNARLRAQIATITEFEPDRLVADDYYDVRLLGAPVHGPTGAVDFVLSAQHLPRDLSGTEVQRLALLLVAAAGRISDLLAKTDQSAAENRTS